jgi:hypothetical protein
MSELSEVRSASTASAVRADLDAMTKDWGTLLGRKLSRKDVLASPMAERSNWDSNGPGLLWQITAIEGGTREGRGHNREFERATRYRRLFDALYADRGLTGFISESNHRSYFNLRLSHLLGVPYISSATRIPFRGQLYRNAAFAHHKILLHRELDRYVDRMNYRVLDRPSMTLPAFAAIALNHASSPADLLAQLAELRSAGRTMRQRRAEWEKGLREGDLKTANRLRAAIDADAIGLCRELIGPVATAASASLAAAASPTTGLTIALVGVCSMIGSMSSERREAIVRRLLRPAEWFLTSTADTARSISAVEQDVARLWSLDDEDINWIVERMHAISKLSPT